jgi:aryl-alcohol dehydrogenase-like predicted oxidoreductase
MKTSEKTASRSAAGSGTIALGGELTVNRLGFGAMRLTGDGIWGPPKDPATAIAVLRRAIEFGVNFIDTADSYGPYVNEELIAEALAPYPKHLVIATKGGWNRPGPNQWTHDATPAHLRKAVEGSLKRLRLDRIDVYQLHIPDPVVPFDASIETLANMQSEGKIRFVALSNVTVERGKSYRSCRSRTGTVSLIANGTMSSIIASAMGSRSSPGFRWEGGRWPAGCWRRLRKRAK